MKVFVTGGSGFVGQFLLEDLKAKGYEVFALARSDRSAKKVRDKGAIPIRGDLAQAQDFSEQLASMDAIVHVAAKIEMWGPYEEFYHINVNGTKALLEAAAAAKVKKFVYISALAVVAEGKELEDIDESYQPSGLPIDPYSKTKALAEQEVLKYQSQMQTIILRPPFIWGPNMRMLEDFRETIEKNGFPTIGKKDHTLATIHVANLNGLIIKSLESEKAQGIYFVSDGEKRPLRLFLKELAKHYGMDTGNRVIPRWLALTLANVVEGIWRLFRISSAPPITRSMVYLMGSEFSVNDAKARRELGFKNVMTMEEGFAGLAG